MPISQHLGRVVVYVLPLAFVVISWLASAGFPYYLDSNESFLSYLHARNLEIWDPWEYAWLTAEATDPERPTSEHFYTHQPNAPRFLHYGLLLLGFRDLPSQVLIIGLVGTGLTSLLLWRLFSNPALLAVPLAAALDYAGFLAWTVNTYRIWMFVLFFGMILAVQRRRPVWLGILSFFVVQLDFGIAVFVGVSAIVFALLMHGWGARRFILAAGVGAAISLILFGLQVLAFYGWDGFLHELAVTYTRRGTIGETRGLARYALQAWHGPLLLLNMVAHDTHNVVVMLMMLWGVLSSAFALRRGSLSEPHRFLAYLTLSVTVGIVAASTVLYGYFVDGFVVSNLPLASFLIAPSLGIVAFEVHRIVSARWSSPHVRMLSAVVVLLPLMVASATQFRPPVAVELFNLLQTEYRGRTIVGPNLGPWHANPELAFALAGGRAFWTSDVDATPEDVRRFESLREADGSLTYICLDTVYLRDRSQPGGHNVCDVAVSRMVPRGHQIVAEGTGWAIMRIGREGEVTAR
jgi:hypothetical protein